MKLINQFTVWYLVVTVTVLCVGGVILYHNIRYEIDKEQSRELKRWLDQVAEKLDRGVPVEKLNKIPVEIRQLKDTTSIAFHVIDTVAIHRQLQRPERQLKGIASYHIDGKHYLISSYDIMVETDDIVDAVEDSLVWIFILLLLLLIISGRLISRFILKPFHVTLASIRSFRLDRTSTIETIKTNTREFNNLNTFLQSMTAKARTDYFALKEFSENASHEMQTPLAIIRGKLELLMGSGINDEQAKHILAAHEAVEKLSKTGQALTLLTQLGNAEFKIHEHVNFSQLIENKLRDITDLAGLRSIAIERSITPHVVVRLNVALAEILLNNLFSNAIRHNQEAGRIKVVLNERALIIQNTGDEPPAEPEQLFQRFRKNARSGSVGLGLAIVKQICELHSFSVHYTFETGWHKIEIKWA